MLKRFLLGVMLISANLYSPAEAQAPLFNFTGVSYESNQLDKCQWRNYCGPDRLNVTGASSHCGCPDDSPVCSGAPWYNCLTCTQCSALGLAECSGCVTPPPAPTPTPTPTPSSTGSSEPGSNNGAPTSAPQTPASTAVNANGCYCSATNVCGPDSCGVTGPTSACGCSAGNKCIGFPEFTCIGENDAMPDSGVDLIIYQPTAVQSLTFETATFDNKGCAWQEKIITELGTRQLVRFSVQIHNMGTENFIIGDPTSEQNKNLFVWSTCHGHYHLYGWTFYQLFDANRNQVAIGHKQGFCLRDTVRVNAKAGNPIATCTNQGISANWGDLYSSQTDGQWIDITDLASGTYYLNLTVNPNRVFREKNYDNNSIEFAIQIP
jgi:hypothetical protein